MRSVNGTAEVIVVGGGIAGLSIGWELARRGLDVRLYEQAALGAGASGRNTGTLLPQTEAEVAAMLAGTVAVYEGLLDGPVPFAWTPRDLLWLAVDEAQEHVARGKAAAVGAEALDGDELRRAAPWLCGEVRSGCLVSGAYSLDANAAIHAMAEAARGAGAKIVTGTRVGLVAAGGVFTDAGRVAADSVVLANGPWLADLLPGAPVRAGRGWLMRTAPLPLAVDWILEEMSWPDQAVLGRAARPQPLADLADGAGEAPVGEAFVVCPQPGGEALIGASLALSLRDAVEGAGAPRRIAERALAVAPSLARRAAVTRAWSGLRPMTPDGLPIAGATEIEGLYVHGGHASLGMQAAPATARWLAAAMTGEETEPLLARLDPRRFEHDLQENRA
jgi:glycine/D-amino acid oxidase-like deaminating enzyme